jgi:starvation-inducible outer membrane lipoprotein
MRWTSLLVLTISFVLAACAAEPPTAGELTAFGDACAKANDGKRVAVEGYLLLPDTFTESESVVLRLYEVLETDSAKIGVTVRFGTDPNRVENVPTEYTDDDLKIHTADGQVVGYQDKVRVSGKVYFPLVDQDFECGLENPLIERAGGG